MEAFLRQVQALASEIIDENASFRTFDSDEVVYISSVRGTFFESSYDTLRYVSIFTYVVYTTDILYHNFSEKAIVSVNFLSL